MSNKNRSKRIDSKPENKTEESEVKGSDNKVEKKEEKTNKIWESTPTVDPNKPKVMANKPAEKPQQEADLLKQAVKNDVEAKIKKAEIAHPGRLFLYDSPQNVLRLMDEIEHKGYKLIRSSEIVVGTLKIYREFRKFIAKEDGL